MTSREDVPPELRGGRIGGAHRRVGIHDRLRGVTRFTADLKRPGMLYAKIVRSPHAHARIESIDATDALAMPGVAAVITGRDLPTPYGIIPWTRDETALAVEKALHVGDGVACVAAEDLATAEAAARAIRIVWEPLPALFDPEEALASEVKVNPHCKHGNLTKEVSLAFGDVDDALARAALVVEGEYRFAGTTHAALEPHCALADVDADGLLTVWSTTQVPHYLHRELARVLDRSPRTIRVIQPPLGGGFGGKSEPLDLELCVAKLALVTGRPVRLLYEREEVFYAHRGRHPMVMHHRAGFDADGRILGVDARSILDGGAYASFGLVTTYYSGQLLCAPYDFPAYRFDSRRAYTNKPACGPKRGHGSVQPRFAMEVQLDKAAHALGIDPIELRRRNAMPAERRTVNELLVGSNGFLDCLAAVEAASEWRARRGKLPFGRGLGVAGSTYISGTNYPIYPNDMPQSAVQVTLDRSGRARVFSGASDIGQGSDTLVAVIVAEELGLAIEDVRVLSADSDLCPVDLGAYSSRTTLMVGNACLDAARELARRVRGSVARSWSISPSRVVLAQGCAFDREEPPRAMLLAEAFQLAEAEHGLLSAAGSYRTPTDRHGSYRGGTIGASPAYSFTAHVAEVEVDVETGEVRVERIWCAHDCGRAISRRLVEGQIEGSTYMGVAEALFEEHAIDAAHGGLHAGPSLLDYRLPTAIDTPPIDAIVVEAPDARGPYGAKEAGEGPLHSSIPAVANAIFDAVGIRLDALPFTPPRVLAAIRANEQRGEIAARGKRVLTGNASPRGSSRAASRGDAS